MALECVVAVFVVGGLALQPVRRVGVLFRGTVLLKIMLDNVHGF